VGVLFICMADPTTNPPIPTVQPKTEPIKPGAAPEKKPNPGVALANPKPGKADKFSSMSPEQLKATETGKAIDLGKLGSAVKATPAGASKDPPPGPRYKTYIKVKIANQTYTNLDGDFLGSPKVVSATRQYSHARILLNDPDEKILKETSDQSDCEVIIGFADGEKRTKLKGKPWSIGRIPPDTTVIMIVDPSAGIKGSANATNSAAEKPSDRPESEKTDASKYWESIVTPKEEELDPFSKIAAELADPKKVTGKKASTNTVTGDSAKKPDLSPVKPPEKTAATANEEKFQATFKGQSPTFDKLMDKVKEVGQIANKNKLNYSTAERLSFTGANSESRLKFQKAIRSNRSVPVRAKRQD
jgi:hypothetical protein